MSQKVVVVGAGVVGLCSAYFLRQRGHEVEVWEKESAQHEGCSYGNGGMIVPSHFVPLAAPGMVAMGMKMMLNPKGPFRIKPRFDFDLFGWMWKFARNANAANVKRSESLLRDLNLASRGLYEEFDQMSGHAFGLESRGLLMLCKNQKSLDHESELASRANEIGLKSDVLDRVGLVSVDPGIDMDVAGGVHYTEDRQFSPPAFMAWMKTELSRLGADIRYGRSLRGCDRSANQVELNYDGGTDRADVLVLATGAWTGEIGKGLGKKMPMQAGKGYSFMVSKPPQMPSVCALLAEARIAVTPMDGKLRFAGTMEIAGIDEEVSAKRVEGIRESIPSFYPKFSESDLGPSPVWSGLRPCTPDGLPYVGALEGLPNVFVAAGHAMMGMSMGPITGEIVVDLVEGKPSRFNLELVRPNRFA